MDRMLLQYHQEAQEKKVKKTQPPTQPPIHLICMSIPSIQVMFLSKEKRRPAHPPTTHPPTQQVLILSACAFDSVPADLGTIYAHKMFLAKGGAALASIESFLTIDSGGKGMYVDFGHVPPTHPPTHPPSQVQ